MVEALACNQSKALNAQLNELYKIRDNHKIWKNPLLINCAEGKLTPEDFQFLFSQYYFYSKNFTRFVAALMVNCEDDMYRSQLSENLWEEGGGADIDRRHTEIFRRFLKKHLRIASLEKVYCKPYTADFVSSYFNLCLNSSLLQSSAVLSFGTESIVPRLYSILKQGLELAGFSGDALLFFNLHIECDDAHSQTIEKIVLSHAHLANWFDVCKSAMILALDARDKFFSDIYADLKNIRLNDLIQRAAFRPSENELAELPDNLVLNTNFASNLLYENKDEANGISFKVERLPFCSDVLDSRLVRIPEGYTNEFHSHAHETVFLILSGKGKVVVGNEAFLVKKDDIVFVPRWHLHQTQNLGKGELRFFAITDYGFTKQFSGNTDMCYRKNAWQSTMHENSSDT